MARMAITVQGRTARFSFAFEGRAEHLAEWHAEGLDVIEISNTIPVWVAELGLTRPWCAAQDLRRWLWS